MNQYGRNPEVSQDGCPEMPFIIVAEPSCLKSVNYKTQKLAYFSALRGARQFDPIPRVQCEGFRSPSSSGARQGTCNQQAKRRLLN